MFAAISGGAEDGLDMVECSREGGGRGERRGRRGKTAPFAEPEGQATPPYVGIGKTYASILLGPAGEHINSRMFEFL